MANSRSLRSSHTTGPAASAQLPPQLATTTASATTTATTATATPASHPSLAPSVFSSPSSPSASTGPTRAIAMARVSRAAASMSLFADGSGDLSNVASSSSTPPKTVADSASLHSDALPSDASKHDLITVAADAADAPPDVDTLRSATRRTRRHRVSSPVYNLSKLSGTDCHGKRRAKGDAVSGRVRRRTMPSHILVGSIEAKPDNDETGVADVSAAPPPSRRRRHTRQCPDGDAEARRAPAAARRPGPAKPGRVGVDGGLALMSRELRRLRDTNEFSGVEDRPVIHTVWSNGKFVDPKETRPTPACRKAKLEAPAAEAPTPEEAPEPVTSTRQRRVKKFLDKGLYAGQDAPLDPAKGLSGSEKKKLAQLPELRPRLPINHAMPPPMYAGLRSLIAGRDFKLPFNVCNPLPPGQPKPDEWKKMIKNRFIGDSKDYWRKLPHLHDYQSKCVCEPNDGCGESCQNRIMLYECDATNCNVGKEFCTNRAFADLTARRTKGGKYRVGVEVIKTSDRGYGVRSNRCFQPNQIIMEYTGEIITEDECERRMNEIYKDNECYYLMSFDQNMIIDATTGSIARFVNHSCKPNCRMIKWIVSGQPRMALFAGDQPIMTGDELTYDYNFDPFSAKNVQACLCGEANCRGILGPKPREVKPTKTDLKTAVKATVKAGKRKLKEFIGDDEADEAKAGSVKKRKGQPKVQPKGQPKNQKATVAARAKQSLSKAGFKVAKGTASAVRRGVTNLSSTAKKAALGSKPPAKRRVGGGGGGEAASSAVSKKTAIKKAIKTYAQVARTSKVISRSSSLTIVAMGGDESSRPGKQASPGKGMPKSCQKLTVSQNGAASPRQPPQDKTMGEVGS